MKDFKIRDFGAGIVVTGAVVALVTFASKNSKEIALNLGVLGIGSVIIGALIMGGGALREKNKSKEA